MVEFEKVVSACASDEATTLIGKILKHDFPSLGDDQVKFATLKLMETLSEQLTVPAGEDCNKYVLTVLREWAGDKSTDTAKAEPATIPPRPLPDGSGYLNLDELKWLAKYDPEVKEAADFYVWTLRIEEPASCNNLSDDMIIELALKMLCGINRRDPATMSKLEASLGCPPTPSFLKQYDEGTPSEIAIRYLNPQSGITHREVADTYSGYSTAKSVNSDDDKSTVAELLLCLFLGGIGAHKFYRKQYGMGILYLCTFGLFGIGVTVDIIKIVIRVCKQ